MPQRRLAPWPVPAGLCAVVALAAAASAATPPAPARPARVDLVPNVAGLEGAFDNALQLARLPAAVARKPTPGQPWVDAQWARFVRFPAPVLGEVVYYLEWRGGGPDGPLTRQRIWAFAGVNGPAPSMRFYTMNDPGMWTAAAADPALLQQLSRAGLHEYPPGCTLAFRRLPDGRLEGRIPPGECRITARESKRTMTIDAAVTIGRDGFLYDEAGTLDDGRPAFRVPEGHRYEFERRPAPAGATPAKPPAQRSR